MDSPQSVVSPFKTSIVGESEGQKYEYSAQSMSKGSEAGRGNTNDNHDDFIGVLEVYVHQARDIHNVCIYHKQDVYAKLCLISDPDNAVSTKIINGGGRNPVFNDNLKLNVKTVESSLKCEIFMMSRVKNYLEDQLLGFTLVPLSEVLMTDGKLEKEFSLSSTDLFHSPAGFVQLGLQYNGVLPEVMELPAGRTAVTTSDVPVKDSKLQESSPCEFEKIEFPDPKMVTENQMMLSEYFGIPCSSVNTETTESFLTCDAENPHSSEVGARFVESFSTATTDSIQAAKPNSPPSSVSTNSVYSPSAAASSDSSDAPAASKIPDQEHSATQKEKRTVDTGESQSGSSGEPPKENITKPLISINLEPEQNVVQQDIVDMYMKSMQQFTESLAKMKLPLDIDNGPPSSGSSSSDQKMQGSKTNGPRVFYGSRAFF